MKQIDKNKEPHKSRANAIIKDYLDNCCLQANGRYEDVRYDSKRDPGHGPCFCNANGGRYRKELSKILLENQDGYCCYCMRKLKTNQNEEDSDELITREHIIPRGFSISNTPADKISYYQVCPELSPAEVILTDEFVDLTHNQTNDLPPYPHKVAYNNLVASCNGTFPYVRNENQGKSKICCNEYRQEKDAYPIYFITGIETMVHYLPTGDIQARSTISVDVQQKINDVIDNAHLDCKALRDIRYMWYLLSHLAKEEIFNCNTEEKRDKLFCKQLYGDSVQDIERASSLHSFFTKDDYWNTFMLYDFFYDVYHVTR